MTNYIIIDNVHTASFFNAETYSGAIFDYAKRVGISTDLQIFKKALSALNIEEAVMLFNDVCVDVSDKISMFLSGYNTLYKKG